MESVLDGTGDIVCDMRVTFTVSQSRGGVCVHLRVEEESLVIQSHYRITVQSWVGI